jgi:hypothetical protein
MVVNPDDYTWFMEVVGLEYWEDENMSPKQGNLEAPTTANSAMHVNVEVL